MDITTALPWGVGAASAALGGAKSITEGVFNLFSGGSEKSADDSPSDGQVTGGDALASLLAPSGMLGADPGQLQEDLNQSLEELHRMIRDAFHQAGLPMPDAFQLQVNADGTIDTSSGDPFALQARSLLEESNEATRVLNQIAAQTAAIDAATRQEKFARTYNEDPAAALAQQEKAGSKRPGIDVAFVDGQAASFQLVSG